MKINIFTVVKSNTNAPRFHADELNNIGAATTHVPHGRTSCRTCSKGRWRCRRALQWAPSGRSAPRADARSTSGTSASNRERSVPGRSCRTCWRWPAVEGGRGEERKGFRVWKGVFQSNFSMFVFRFKPAFVLPLVDWESGKLFRVLFTIVHGSVAI